MSSADQVILQSEARELLSNLLNTEISSSVNFVEYYE
jgi:hypothetical protein